jgi:2-polyprenyl-3-methyl-5-hydroxy-6-metoxy-1,4-benzoquinol methylase
MDKKKLNRLIKFYRRRLAEEEDFYNKKLTELDLAANEVINEKTPESIAQLKKSLNTIYKTSDGLMGSTKLPLFLRRFIHKILHFVLGPYFKNQNDFNAQTVHLINECLSQLNAHKIKEAKAYDALVQFNQRIIALMDVKELNAAHKNFKMLLEMQNQIMDEINRLKETLMIAYEGVDRRLLSFMAQQLNTRQRLDTMKLDKEEETAASEKIRIGLEMPDREMSELNALYLAFENRYRGSEELIKKRLMKYLSVIDSHEKILDIGCGRGEFLELIKEKDLTGYGIDLNSEMIKRCREKKLDVLEEDIFQHLSKVPEESLGAVVCTHVIEHIPHYLWKELLNL